MKLHTLYDLFTQELQDLYDAERQILEIMPSMIRTAKSEQLKQVFETMEEKVNEQLMQLEKLGERLDIAGEGKRCVGMEGIVEEGIELVDENSQSAVLDAALIGIAQRMEHYEIAGYGCAAAYAKELGFDYAAETLSHAVHEKKHTDSLLSRLAEESINPSVKQQAQKQ